MVLGLFDTTQELSGDVVVSPELSLIWVEMKSWEYTHVHSVIQADASEMQSRAQHYQLQASGKGCGFQYEFPGQRRKSQGVDFSNLILLTKSAMKVRRNQTKGSKKFYSDAPGSSSGSSCSNKTLHPKTTSLDVGACGTGPIRWHDKASNHADTHFIFQRPNWARFIQSFKKFLRKLIPQFLRREREFVTVSTTEHGHHRHRPSTTTSRSESAGSGASSPQSRRSVDDDPFRGPRGVRRPESTDSSSSVSSIEEPTCPRKRLYRDVMLGNDSSPDPHEIPTTRTSCDNICSGDTTLGKESSLDDDASCFERKYDELERQAMEQYRTSEECLALRYQELEQQAMDQYKNAASSETINIDLESQLSDVRNTCDGSCQTPDGDDSLENCEETPSFSVSDSTREALLSNPEGSDELQQRIQILRSESCGSLPGPVHRAASEGNLRPIAVARRLGSVSTNSHKRSRESKNLFRGASEEKIVKASSLTSLKRRLVPMSPMEYNEPGANLMRNIYHDPMKTVKTLDKHVASYYQNTQVFQMGSGDDKTNEARGHFYLFLHYCFTFLFIAERFIVHIILTLHPLLECWYVVGKGTESNIAVQKFLQNQIGWG
ncbi:hypothetical protein QAD02_024204 [Eretmocerus hayati]|uniref:Uncharacterized protein n=1 Tax=Eretmocerus hayati TaxID=131215 RepID=A0ACC2PYQ5_9HYME|nr:hypothetical protein QAD02_024204 [Eretmocerus hayati]